MCVSSVMGGEPEKADKARLVFSSHFVIVGAIDVLALGKELLEQVLLLVVASLGE